MSIPSVQLLPHVTCMNIANSPRSKGIYIMVNSPNYGIPLPPVRVLKFGEKSGKYEKLP